MTNGLQLEQETPIMSASKVVFMPVIHSLLESDLYKWTMGQPMLHSMPTNQAEYRFVCRNAPVFPLSELAAEVDEQLDALCELHYTEDELGYLGKLRYLKSDYIDFLRLFKFQRRFITVSTRGNTLSVVANGPQVHVMGFEIYVLAIINELYFRRLVTVQGGQAAFLAEGRKRLAGKIVRLRDAAAQGTSIRHPFEFFDFGVRRRFSGIWQEEVVETLARELPQFFKGTSNVYLAKKFNLTPIGTMAHEYLQTFQAMPGVQLKVFQKQALETWVHEYRGDLGTALTDVVGMDAFFADFDLYFAKLFDTCELQPWTHNCESVNVWTLSVDEAQEVRMHGYLVPPYFVLKNSKASSGGQLACPRERVRAGEPVCQPAETTARGGRPQAEERVPVPVRARAARTGWLSTGGRVNRSRSLNHAFHFRSSVLSALS